jgi:serine/threonine protein kinase
LMYVAPEALSGEIVTPKADQYSLATIAYFLLTACHPYVAKTPREMFSQLLSQPPIPLNSARPGLRFPTAVESVVMRGLSRDPAKRYATVLEFAVELRDMLNKAPADTNGEDDAAGGLLSKIKSLFRGN